MEEFFDYYEALELTRSCTSTEIKKQYRKLAMRYHPDKNSSDEAAKRFKEIGEAYNVLIEPKSRAIYDRLGIEGLRESVESSEGYAKSSAEETFSAFFGQRNPFANFEFANDFKKDKILPKGTDVVNQLPCTLEELFHGCVKKFNITRKTQFIEGGDYFEESKLLTINVKPGWKIGTKLTFANEGDAKFGHQPADIVFIISEDESDQSKQVYRRLGDDLVYTHEISLLDALLGGTIHVVTLDQRELSIACPEIVSPTYEKVVKGEGMPISKEPGQRGNLVIKFNITFPTYLSMGKRQKLKDVLYCPQVLP